MVDMTAKHQNFVSRTIEISEALLEVVDDLNDLAQEWDDLGLSATITGTAFEGDNAHIGISDLAALKTAQIAINQLFSSGVRATLLKFRR